MPDRTLLTRWAADTWRSFEAMTDPDTGLPTDSIAASLDPATRSGYTSPTNIGGRSGAPSRPATSALVDADEARDRLARLLTTLAGMEVHDESGMFFNWYDDRSGALLRQMPDSGHEIQQFLSSVDNGWLAAGLMVAAAAEPRSRRRPHVVLDRMDFGVFHDAAAGPDGPGGRLTGGFWVEDPGVDTRRAPSSPVTRDVLPHEAPLRPARLRAADRELRRRSPAARSRPSTMPRSTRRCGTTAAATSCRPSAVRCSRP